MNKTIESREIRLVESGLIFAQDKDGNLVGVDDVPNGLACECSCPFCDGPLIARNNSQKVTSHFAHYSKDVDKASLDKCSYEFWRSLHYMAYLELKKAPYIDFPDVIVSEKRNVAGVAYSDVVNVEKKRRVVLKDVHLVKVNNRRLMDIVATIDNGQQIIIYPNIPVLNSKNPLSDINNDPRSWRNSPVLMINFDKQFMPIKGEMYPLRMFLNGLHYNSAREWHLDTSHVALLKSEVKKKADMWEAEIKTLERDDLSFLASRWLNRDPVDFSDISYGLKTPKRGDASGSILGFRSAVLNKESHLYATAEVKDNNGNDAIVLFTPSQSFFPIKGIKGKPVINVVVNKSSDPSSWPISWIKLPSEAAQELEAIIKEQNKELLTVTEDELVLGFINAAVNSAMIDDRTWSAFVAQGYIDKSATASLQSFLQIASRLIRKEHANTPVAVSLVEKIIEKDNMWSKAIIGAMSKFGTLELVSSKLSAENQIYCMITSLSDNEPSFCSILFPAMEDLSRRPDQHTINFVLPVAEKKDNDLKVAEMTV
jgi:hypothetical protein